jgi:hypothetical protein
METDHEGAAMVADQATMADMARVGMPEMPCRYAAGQILFVY